MLRKTNNEKVGEQNEGKDCLQLIITFYHVYALQIFKF